MKTTKYTEKQIREAISYWNTVLVVQEALDEAVEAAGRRLDESQEARLGEVRDRLAKQVRSPSGVGRFVDRNDGKVEKSGDPALKRAWDALKAVLAAGTKGVAWLKRHWKAVLALLAAVVIVAAWPGAGGVAKAVGKALLAVFEKAVSAVADGLANLLGPEYMKAGLAIDKANRAAGGYGGWTGAGLGGGLR